MEAIRIENLSVAYENHTIIKNMNLSLPKGKINIIIGGNGCFPPYFYPLRSSVST